MIHLKYLLFLLYISHIHFNLSLNLQVKRNNVFSLEIKCIKSTIPWALYGRLVIHQIAVNSTFYICFLWKIKRMMSVIKLYVTFLFHLLF